MKRKLFQTLCGALVALLCMSLSSCDEFWSWLDNPVTININLGGEDGEGGKNGENPVEPKKYASIELQPLTFEAAKPNVTVTFKFKDGALPDYRKVEYSFDGYTWTALSSPAQPILLKNVGDIVMFQGTNPSYNGDAQFVIEQASGTRGSSDNHGIPHYALGYGNPCSILSKVKSGDGRYTTMLGIENTNAFMNLFGGALLDLKTDEEGSLLFQMPTVLAASSCAGMFAGSAISALDLPAQELKKDCYNGICEGCSNLKTVQIDAVTCEGNLTVDDCAKNMLKGAGSEAEGGELNLIYHYDGNGHTNFGTNPLVFDDLINASGLSTDVPYNAMVSVADENGEWTEATSYTPATELSITFPNVLPLKLTVGEKYTSYATLLPDRTYNKFIRWKSDNPEIAKLESTTNTSNVVTAVAPGTTKIHLSFGQLSAFFTVDVNAAPATDPEPGKMTVSATGYKGTYDGKAHGITVTVTEPATGATIKYGEKEGTYDKDESPTYTDVGEYTVYYQVTCDDYKTATGSAKVVITKANAEISFQNSSVTKTYGDKAFTIEASNSGDGTVKYSSSNKAVAVVGESSGQVEIIGVGKATITAKVDDGTNYTYKTKEASYSLEVKPKGTISDYDKKDSQDW